ncbi:MAG TPA: hypothetical protein HPP56_06455 [Nitrospirae bacterium]|nr:hypothetical protein [Nitrospirota bacterium]
MAINYQDRIVITGIGLLTPFGKGVKDNISALFDFKTGINLHQISQNNEELLYLGKITDSLAIDIPKSLSGQYKFLNRGGQIGLYSAIEAMADIDISAIPPEDRAFFLATGDLSNTGCEFMYPANKAALDKDNKIDYKKLNKAGLNKVNPFFLLDSIANNPFSFISSYFEFMGDNTSISSLSPSGALAIELACRSLKQGRSSIALVIGSTTWINPVSLYEMQGLGLLSRCKEGAKSFKPLDRFRDGFIPAEGGASIVLEKEQSAIQRGHKIYGSIVSSSCQCETMSRDTISVPEMITLNAIDGLIKSSQKSIDDFAFICLHGSGSKKGDKSELESVKNIFEKYNTRIPICALKSYTGHMGCASDLFDIIMSLQFLNQNKIPKTLNFEEAERQFINLPITKSIIDTDKSLFISISNGLGNQSVAFIIEKANY